MIQSADCPKNLPSYCSVKFFYIVCILLVSLSLKDISEIIGRQVRPKKWDKDLLKSLTDSSIKLMSSYGIRMLYFYDSDFPPQLREIPDHPFTVFYRGLLPSPEQPMLDSDGCQDNPQPN